MNFIHSLQAHNAKRDQQRIEAVKDADDFLAVLHSAKFTGQEDGERKDWIATGDVIAWLREFRLKLTD